MPEGVGMNMESDPPLETVHQLIDAPRRIGQAAIVDQDGRHPRMVPVSRLVALDRRGELGGDRYTARLLALGAGVQRTRSSTPPRSNESSTRSESPSGALTATPQGSAARTPLP